MSARRPCVFLPALGAALVAITGPLCNAARAADSPQSVTLTTGDGAKLSARYFPGNQGGKSPAVIVLDDFAESARPETCDEIARQLAKEGCAVLCFDFRGTGRSRNVEAEFWDNANNRQQVKGYKADEPPQTIQFSDFKPGYLPTMVNDVAAARAYLERQNDARECNTGQMYVIGFGRGATLGQLWLASEWSRFRVSGSQSKLAANPDGRDVAGCVWIGPKLSLDKQAVPMLDLMRRTEAKKSTLIGLIHYANDSEGARFARQCQDVLNLKDKTPLVATRAVSHDGKSLAARGEVAEQTGKFIEGMRKVQELPPWDDRDFGDRRYVWAFRGGPLVSAKDEGDYFFQPIPIDQLLGKR